MPNATLPEPPVTIRPLTDDQSNWLRQRYPDLAYTPDKCITCGGKKTFRWYAPGSRDEVVTYDCPCPDQFLLHRAFLHSGIGVNFQRLGWDDFTHIDPAHKETVADYLANNDNYVRAGIGLIAYGPMGNGKSMLGNLLTKGLISFGHSGFYTTFSEMLNTFAGGWHDKEERLWFHARVKNAGVLCIDDLGRESKREEFVGKERAAATGETVGKVRTTRSWVENALEETIRHRVANSKPTIITTNLDPERIEAGYGGHLLSLLRERCFTLRFTGEDRRSEMRVRFINEARDGLRRPVMIG